MHPFTLTDEQTAQVCGGTLSPISLASAEAGQLPPGFVIPPDCEMPAPEPFPYYSTQALGEEGGLPPAALA